MRPHTRFLLNIMMSDIWTVLFGALFFVLWICQGILAHNDWKTWWRVDCLNTFIIMYVIVSQVANDLSTYIIWTFSQNIDSWP